MHCYIATKMSALQTTDPDRTHGSGLGGPTGRGGQPRILLTWILAVWILGPSAGRAGTSFAEDQPLRTALEALAQHDLDLLYNEAVVLPEMRVLVEPADDLAPLEKLRFLVAPYGLEISNRNGVHVLSPPAEGPWAPGTLAGRVVGLGPETGVPHATLHVLELGVRRSASADGRFRIEGLPPGTYAVECSAPGFATLRTADIEIGTDATVRRDLRLQPEPFLHDEIVVRSSRVTLLEERPSAPLSLDRRTIESLPNLGGDLFRAASLLPGLASSDISAQFVVRGGRRDEVQVLLDGQELYSPFHLRDFDNALSIVPVEGLDEADLTTGGFPAVFGDRMSGVLDLTTRHPEAAAETLLSVSFVDLLAQHIRPFAEDRGRLLLSARRGAIELAHDVIGQEDPSFWSTFGRISYDTSPGQFAARGLFTGDELRFSERDGDESKELRTDYENAYLWGEYHRVIGNRTLVESGASLARTRQDRFGFEDEEEKSFAIGDRRELEVSSLHQAWSAQFSPRHSLAAGVRWRQYAADYTYHNQLEPAFEVIGPLIDSRPTLRSFEGEFSSDHWEGWWSERVAIKAATVELGLRYDRHELTHEERFSPRISAALALTPSMVLRTSWGVFRQSQRPYELAVEDSLTDFVRSERSDHAALGLEHHFPAHSKFTALRVELYHREIRHPRTRYENALEPVNTFPEVEPDRLRVTPSRARSQGIEFLLRGRWTPSVRWWAGYSLSRAEDRLVDSNPGGWTPRSQDQRHALSLNLETQLSPRWSLAASWRYHTGWPTTPVRFLTEAAEREDEEDLDPDDEPIGQVASLGTFNSERLPAYHRLDLRLARSWSRPRAEITFFVDVQNLYDRSNLAGFDIAPDDDDQLELSAEEWPGIYPSLGISWRF